MDIVLRKKEIPSFDPESIAIKRIEYYPSGGTYTEEQITPKLIRKILKEVPEGIGVYLFLDPNGECDWMEVLSDGEWLSLGCYFDVDDGNEYVYTYNPNYAHTETQVDLANYSDTNVWTDLESGGQSPIPKLYATTELELCTKAVEYFIHTGKIYPGADWAYDKD